MAARCHDSTRSQRDCRRMVSGRSLEVDALSDTRMVVLVVACDRLLARDARRTQGTDRRALVAATGCDALVLAGRILVDAMLVSTDLRDMHHLDVVAALRRWSEVPIIVVGEQHNASESIAALEAGADDYVSRAMEPEEVVARLQRARRSASRSLADSPSVATDHFVIDLQSKRVLSQDGEVRLTGKEWAIVEVLTRRPGTLVSRTTILREVWGAGYEDATHYLRVFMANLRSKLEPDPSRPRYFITEPGLGVRFEPASRVSDANRAPEPGILPGVTDDRRLHPEPDERTATAPVGCHLAPGPVRQRRAMCRRCELRSANSWPRCRWLPTSSSIRLRSEVSPASRSPSRATKPRT